MEEFDSLAQNEIIHCCTWVFVAFLFDMHFAKRDS